MGQQEFRHACAVCHGLGGKGDSVMTTLNLLTVRPTDLTQLSKKHQGQFPFWQVYRIIDGREEVKGHGPATCRFGVRCFASQKGANASMKPARSDESWPLFITSSPFRNSSAVCDMPQVLVCDAARWSKSQAMEAAATHQSRHGAGCGTTDGRPHQAKGWLSYLYSLERRSISAGPAVL